MNSEEKDFIDALEGKHYKYVKKYSNPPEYSEWMTEAEIILDSRFMNLEGMDWGIVHRDDITKIIK